MDKNTPSLDEFKVKIETLLGQSLSRPALEATEDFWKHWDSLSLLISRRSLAVHVDALYLSQVFPQYTRYHTWKGAGIIALLLGMISIWFFWQLGTVLVVAGIGLRFWGNRVKYNDAKDFAEEIMKEATLNPSDDGYAKLCVNYIAGTIQLVSPAGIARWPQFPSNVITGEQSYIST